MASTSSPGFHPMDSNQVLYRATLQDAAAGGALLMGKLVVAARQELQTREAAARDLRQRDALVESAKLLRQHEATLCQRYPQALTHAFEAPSDSGKKTAMSELNFDQLELMDETEVLSSVAMARMRQVSVLATESSLIELNGLMARLQGHGAVQSDANPLRPESYIAALDAVLQQLPVASDMRLEWIAVMGEALARELGHMYGALCARLRREGVVAAGYVAATREVVARGSGVGRGVAQDAWMPSGQGERVASAPPIVRAPARAELAPPADAVPAPAAPGLQQETLLTLEKLRRLLSGELAGPPPVSRVQQFSAQFAQMFENAAAPAQEPLGTDFDATVPAALEALTEMRQVDQVLQTLEQRRAGGAPAAAAPPDSVASARLALRARARDIAQALSLEVVALMVDNMARDARLLAPVQALVRSVEPALMQLSLVDPRFFTDKHHAARKLLQEITQRSMAFESVEARGFAEFLAHIKQVLQPLMSGTIDSAEPFEAMLQVLQRSWERASRSQELDRQVAVDVLKHAESRNLLAEKIARGIVAHPESRRVPAVVINFLCDPWAQVVAQARLKSGADLSQADKYQALIPALLWSAHPELARQSPAKLTRLVPRLLSTLREGLETIHYPSTKTSAFLESLMQIHQQAFRAHEDPAAAAPVVLAEATPSIAWMEQGNPWIAPGEAASSNFVELADVPELPPLPGLPSVALPAQDANRTLGDADFPIGCWVEWLVDGKWVRTQLSWSSPHGTLFLFTSAFGSTQSMTRRTRDRLIASGGLRLISAQPVLDEALDAVAKTAMRNSVDSAY